MKKVLLVGNPNSGKTTLFNMLTSSNEHTGNWHGVTIDSKEKSFDCDGENVLLVDTPGIYSLVPFSIEEKVSKQTIEDNREEKIINICDKNNLQRNIYLTLCLLEAGLDVFVVINCIDKKSLYQVDTKGLSAELNVDVIQVNAAKKEDAKIIKKMAKNRRRIAILPYFNSNFKQKTEIEKCKIRYKFVEEIIKKHTKKVKKIYGENKLDKIVLNKILAIPIFLFVMATIFYLTFFSIGSYLSNTLSNLLDVCMKPLLAILQSNESEWFFKLVETAIIGGLCSVLSFLPQIVLLFFFLSVLEESGYMSRIAFVFEDLLGKIGLSGRSIYTILMGFGCSTSAIMTARTMEDKNSKIKTALLCPYMSCSAKIPIYVVVGGAFFGAANLFLIMLLYLFGIILATLFAWIENKTCLKSGKQSFILEFPPYRKMSAKKIVKLLVKNSKEFLLKIGSIMVAMNVVVWFLSSFSFSLKYVAESGGSVLEWIGKFLAPIFVPLGFGRWQIVCCLLSGFVAKEVVVSSIAIFNRIDGNAIKLISNSILLSSSPVFFASKASVLSFLVYCLLYTPCISSVVMLRQEVGKKWTAFAVLTQLFVAYVAAFFVYNFVFALEIFGPARCFCVLFGVVFILLSVILISKKIRSKENCFGCSKNCKNFDNCNMKEKIDKKNHL